jgi:hypothetical protein
LLGRIIYWLAVLAVSIALLILLVLFFESRDDSEVGAGAGSERTAVSAPPVARAAP